MPEKVDDSSVIPLFEMNEAEAWLMSDDTLEMLFSNQWLYPSAAVIDEQPGTEQRSGRCVMHRTLQNAADVMPVVYGKQVKVCAPAFMFIVGLTKLHC